MVDEMLKLLDSESWEEHLVPLTVYAERLLRERTWRGERGGPVPGGRAGIDFAKEAIIDLLSGQRVWNRNAYPDVRKFLFSVIRSKVSNTVRSKNNQEIRAEAAAMQPNSKGLSSKEPHSDDDHTVYEMLDLVKNEPDLYAYMEAVFDGYDTRAEIADRLGISSLAVTNLHKKMRRRLDDYYKEQRNHGH